jgi:xanthine dehydrogenase YagS FAD-binding subunit
MRACERTLIGKAPGRPAFELAAQQALDGAQPLSGNRFKVDLLRRTIVRALEMAGEIA